MNYQNLILCPILAFLLTACISMPPPRPEVIATANYGEKPSHSEMTSAVKKYMSARLIDPYSATYQCYRSEKAWVIGGSGSQGNAESGKVYFGYLSQCIINAKNRLGGYTGAKEYTFMIYEENGQRKFVHFDGFRAADYVK